MNSFHFSLLLRKGSGYLEKTHSRALQIEVTRRRLQTELEVPIKVYYTGAVAAQYAADLLADRKVMVELKGANVSQAQDAEPWRNELRATGIEVGFFINFNREPIELNVWSFPFHPRESVVGNYEKSSHRGEPTSKLRRLIL